MTTGTTINPGKGEYLFCYGGNLNPAQINARCDRPVAAAAARLPGFRLGFFGYSRIWDGALETAMPDLTEEIWGVLYFLSFRDRERLDVWQDARLDGSGTYFHYPVTVIAGDRSITAVMYRKDLLGEPRLPSSEYRDFIAQGAEFHQLPPDYCAALRRIPAVPAGYGVPRQKDFGRILDLVDGCSACGG